MTFETGPYLEQSGRKGFYPRVTVDFEIEATDQHYHVPLLLSPFGYSTYRGS
jgi:5-hydroxyisourate hydrolase